MKRHVFALALLLLCGASEAATITSNASGRWTAAGTGPWGGSPTSADDFVVASGHRVYVDHASAVALTAAGSVTIQSGGTLAIDGGNLLTPGEFLKAEPGSTLETEGFVRAICRLATEPTWAADPVVRLDCDASVAAATTDYIVYLPPEDEPSEGTYNGKVVKIGSGYTPGAISPSLNRYAWYDITAVSGNTVTYDIDSGSYAGATDQPYQGTRGNPSTTAFDVNGADNVYGTGSDDDLTYTLMENGLYTRALIRAGFSTGIVLMHADLGSYYLYYEENADSADDPTFCSGKAFKIRMTENDNSGGDQLYLDGDATGCTNGTPRLIPGARRGDRVALVTPATIDGFITAAPHTSYVWIESGATIKSRWTRFTRLGQASRTGFSPTTARNCSLCFLQSSSAPTAKINGYLLDSEISFPEANSVNDTATLYFSGMAQSGTDTRFPNGGLLDMGGLRVERLHVHDARNDSGAGDASGTHLIYGEAVKDLLIDGARLERSSDDGIGGQILSNTTGTSTDKVSMRFFRILSYEHIAEQDNSQEGVEPGYVHGLLQATTGIDSAIYNAGAIHARDIVAIGARGSTMALTGTTGDRYERVVSGGSLLTVSNSFTAACVDGTSQLDTHHSDYLTTVSNSLIGTFSGDGTANSAFPHLCLKVEDSIAYGLAQSSSSSDNSSTADAYQSLMACSGSALLHVAASGANVVINANQPNAYIGTQPRPFRDCAFVSALAQTLGFQYGTGTTPIELVRDRVLFLTGATTFFSGWGPEDLGTGAVTGALNLWASNAGPGTDPDFLIDSGVTAGNLCLRSNKTAATLYGAKASATTIARPDMTSQASQARIGTLVGDPTLVSQNTCEAAKPINLGLSQVGMAHVMMGDGLLEQLFPTYTSRKNLIQVTPPQLYQRTTRGR